MARTPEAAEAAFATARTGALEALTEARRIRSVAGGRSFTSNQEVAHDQAISQLTDSLTELFGDEVADDLTRRHRGDLDAIETAVRALQSPGHRLEAAEAARALHAGVLTPGGMSERELFVDAFREARIGNAQSFTSSFSAEARALATSSSLVPVTFADSVVTYQRTLSPVIGLATTLVRDSGADVILPRLTADPNTGGTVTLEAGTISEADPTFSSVTLSPYKYGTISNWSSELEADTGITGFTDLVARSVARDLSLSYGAHLTTGTGTTQPWGYLTRAGNGGTALGTAAVAGQSYVSWVDMATLFGSVAVPYRQTGTFVVSDDLYIHMLKWRDANGAPILQQGLGDAPATLFSRPVVVDPNLQSLGSASRSAVFGSFDRYYIVRTPMRVEMSRDYKWSTDQVSLRVVDRIDGDLVDTAALRYLVSASS